ncbi:Multidrug export protein MepA [BD1-7 clade bacterium]|uniref:Multidrug-efflux transporter n=1 Tax=BD1-7 clade bacterium TaxID=2029982 RepID=A0A5S9NPZ8_9GAMM|nr:Multidrug export protein MepA [BD1-7 clade bacterium]
MTNPLLEQPIKRSLIMMTAPAAFGMLMTFLFQLVDSYFIGKLGSVELAAVGFAFPAYFIIVSMFMGISAGVSSAVAKMLGEKKPKAAALVTSQSLVVFILLAVGLGTGGYSSIAPVFRLLGAPDTMLGLIDDYMQPIYLGMFALVGTLIGNAALMSKGLMVKSTAIMGIAGIINLVFDYVFIFGYGPIPAMALAGAAYATVLSWSVSLLLMLVVLHRENLLDVTVLAQWKSYYQPMREVMKLSTPAVAAQILNPVAIAVVTRLISQYGSDAVAAFGIATRIQSLGLTLVLALSVVITPLAAQHYGAKLHQRLDDISALAGRIVVYWSLGLYAILSFFASAITSIFTDDQTIIYISQQYFTWVGVSFTGFGLVMITTGFFNGVQQPGLSLRLTLVLYLVLTIPLAILGSMIDLKAVWLAITGSNLLSIIYAKYLMNRWRESQGIKPAQEIWRDYADNIRSLSKDFGTK